MSVVLHRDAFCDILIAAPHVRRVFHLVLHISLFVIQVMIEVLGVNRLEEVSVAYSGDNIKLRLKGIEEEVCL